MPFSMYQASVPAFQRTLAATSAILDKAESYAEARKIDPSALLTARLYPDMFHFTKQVQLVSDFSKGPSARLAGVEVPSYADTESTFDELRARLAKTVAFISGLKPEQFEGAEDREISLKIGGQAMSFTGQEYLIGLALPNFSFHATTAYAILRHNGLELGKRDFIPAR